MWFITLLVLAVAAVLIIKAVKAHSDRQSAALEDLPVVPGIQGSLRRPEPTSSTESPPGAPDATPRAASDTQAASTSADPVAVGQDATSPVDSRSSVDDIREMIKVLNLTDSDSPRLGISPEEFNALRNQENAQSTDLPLPDARTQSDVADRLRKMLS